MRLQNILSFLALFLCIGSSWASPVNENLLLHVVHAGPVSEDLSWKKNGIIPMGGNLNHAPGPYGQQRGAIKLDGNFQYLSLGTSPEFNGLEQMTLAIWVKISPNSGHASILSQVSFADGTWTTDPWELSYNKNTKTIRIDATDGTTDAKFEVPLPDPNKWHFIHATIDTISAEMRLYFDGVQVGNGVAPNSPLLSNTALPILIGAAYQDDGIDGQGYKKSGIEKPLTGNIGEVFIWKGIRSLDDMKNVCGNKCN